MKLSSYRYLRIDKFLSRSTVDLYLKTVLWSEKSIFSTVIPGLEELRARRWRWHSLEIFWVLINFVILSGDGGRCRLGQSWATSRQEPPLLPTTLRLLFPALTPISGFLESILFREERKRLQCVGFMYVPIVLTIIHSAIVHRDRDYHWFSILNLIQNLI